MSALNGNNKSMVSEGACPAGPEETSAEEVKNTMHSAYRVPTSTSSPFQADVLNAFVTVQQRYVVMPPRRHQLLLDTSVLHSDPLPATSDNVSAGRLPLYPSRYIIDELATMPMKKKESGRSKHQLLTKGGALLALGTYLVLSSYRASTREAGGCSSLRSLGVVGVLIIIIVPFLGHVLSDAFENCSKIKEKVNIYMADFITEPAWRTLAAMCVGHIARVTRGEMRRLLPLSGAALLFCVATLLSHDPSRVVAACLSLSMAHGNPSDNQLIWNFVLWYVSAVALLEWKTLGPVLSCVSSELRDCAQLASSGFNEIFNSFAVGINFTVPPEDRGSAFLDAMDIEAPFLLRILRQFFFVSFWINVVHCCSPLRAGFVSAFRMLALCSGATITETACAVSNVFVSMGESLLLVHPYMSAMTPSEVFTALTCGFATCSANIIPELVDAGVQLNDVIASVLLGSVGCLCMSKLVIPEADKVKVKTGHFSVDSSQPFWFVETFWSELMLSLTLATCIMGSLVAFVTLHAAADTIISWMADTAGIQPFGAEMALGIALTPVACVLGLPWNHTKVVSRVMSLKVLLNEPKAAIYLKDHTSAIGVRSRAVATQCMCGLASLWSSGVALSAVQLLLPQRMDELANLVPPAMLTASTVALVNGCFASLLVDDEETPDLRSFTRKGGLQ